MKSAPFPDIAAYIAAQPEDTHATLRALRDVIAAAAPEADETISYGMPAFRYKGHVLVYFAAAKAHYGFYPTSGPILAFADVLKDYPVSKGAVRLPKDKPLPAGLIRDIVVFRMAAVDDQLAARAAADGKGKKPA